MSRRMAVLLSGGLIICGVTLVPVMVASYSSGPLDALTGAPGESTCTACHGSAAGDGSLSILGAPSTYIPGQGYTITVRLEDEGQQRWGFELTAIDPEGAGAGSFIITAPTLTQLSDQPAPARDYVKHTSNGTFNGTAHGPVNWSFTWQAPLNNIGQVRFYAAGNAANGNFSSTGDFIYTASRTADAPAACCDLPGDVNNNGAVNIIDVTYLVAYLYKSGPALPCPDEANANGAYPVNIIDVAYLLSTLYKNGPDPVCP